MVPYDLLAEGIMKGDLSLVESEVSKALNQWVEARNILVNGLIGAMGIVGKRFAAGEMFLPEVLMSASAMHRGVEIVKTLLSKSEQEGARRIVMGTVEGDIHDIGKDIVSFLLDVNGFEVRDIGIDIPPAKFVAFSQHRGIRVQKGSRTAHSGG